MSNPTTESIRSALEAADLEIYQTEGDTVRLAERVRFHMMDSGVYVRADAGVTCGLTVRAQRSDFPQATEDELFERVRSAVASDATSRGFREVRATPVNVNDPVDETKVLDVWFEITLEKNAEAPEALVDDLRWALGVDKYVGA